MGGIAALAWLFTGNVTTTVILALAGIFGSVMMTTKDQSNLSVVDQVQNLIRFYADRKSTRTATGTNGGLNNVRSHSRLLSVAGRSRLKDEAALWCDSYNINMDCRNFIQAKAMTVMNSRELDSFIGELVRFYGVERAIYVLSRTVQFSDWDSRFDQAVLDRAGQTDFPDARTPRDENHVDPTTRYVTEIDPCVANAIFMKLMELEEEQEAIAQMENDGQKELDEDMALEM